MFRNNKLVIILLCFVCQGCISSLQNTFSSNKTPTDVLSGEDIKSQASGAFAKGDYIKSSALYEKLLAKDPGNQEILFYYAESLRISGNTAKALEQYNNLIAKDKNNLSAIEGKGLSLLQQGEIKPALSELNFVAEKDPSRWRVLNAMGVIYSIDGEPDKAMKYYNMALEVSRNNASIINNMALGVSFSGDYARGIELLNNALANMTQGDKKKILESNLALIYGVSGKMDEAEAILRRNLPEPAVYNNLGFYSNLASDKKLAWSYLSKAISSSPVFYEKAENNLKDLENPATEFSNNKLETKQQNKQPDNQTKLAGLSKSEIEDLQITEGQKTKFPPVKAWRGTHKLPLPTIRPQY